MYLDKPLRAHTLFQAVTRTNRRWTNPATGQEKFYGLIVDYIGLGAELAKAVAVRNMGGKKALPTDVERVVRGPRGGHHRDDGALRGHRPDGGGLRAVDGRAGGAGGPSRPGRPSPQSFLRCEALFELLWPDTRLRPVEDDYRWLARVYASVRPSVDANVLLWHRLGEKTRAIDRRAHRRVSRSSRRRPRPSPSTPGPSRPCGS